MITISNFLEKYSELANIYNNFDETLKIMTLCSQDDPKPNSIVFISKKKALDKVLSSEVSAVVVPKEHAVDAIKTLNINIIASKNPRLLMALCSTELFGLDKLKNQFKDLNPEELLTKSFIHPTAQVSKTALIGPNVFIGPNAVIEDGVVIGANSVIQSNSLIKKDCRIHESVFVGHGSVLGEACELHPQAAIGIEGFGYGSSFETGEHHAINHQGHVVLEDHVHIGSGTKVDRGTFGFTKICKHTKIDNLCHISHNCFIGPYSLITAGFKVAGSTKIGAFLTTGGNASVGGHLNICDNVNLAGLCAVSGNITEPGSYYGSPLQPLKEGLKNRATFGNLYKMRKDLNRVLKKLSI
jgi:UDP-3-O-[3-hydroxymyristoyl] glucosamine N-acyltransferase